MSKQLSRRAFIKSAAAGSVAILGYDPRLRSWITPAQAQTSSFKSVPKLDGVLLFDEASRNAIAVDRGNLFHRVPVAVLNPGSVQDVVKMVQYANKYSLKIVMRGQGHSRYGQSQAEAGIVIDSSTLNAIQPPNHDSVYAGPGAFWGDVAKTTLAKNLTPPVFADTMTLTVGGTLSVGGLGNTSQHFGAQVDNATELDVVTGDGRLVTCSPQHESELFNMVIAGLGQCGIIVRARIRLIPAPSNVVLHNLVYDDLETYLSDQKQVVTEGRFDHQYGTASRKRNSPWIFTMQLGKFYTPPDEPSLAPLEQGLRFRSQADPVRLTYSEYLHRFDARNADEISSGKAARPTPNIAVWIPASATKDYVAPILAMSSDVAGVDLFSFWPLNTRRFTRPLFRVPDQEIVFSIWMNRSVAPNDPAALSAMLESNQELLQQMIAAGGKDYRQYGIVRSQAEWAEHFGPNVWRRFSAAKKKFDPNQVLTPGPKIFH
ncbi:MAG TPA: FAD-binding protein [Candidatus Saccharimonadales bacterium]|jgi:cytokinin dehydrogenase|nr:FAD-binding protein [Candidatus Saccharimonadales bacterium]